MKNLKLTLAGLAVCFILQSSLAQHAHLHVNSKWSECSFQLDPSLTQEAWQEFTKEAGLVAYFRPLIDASPIGAKKFEVSILQWSTKIDDTKDAWNDTFVHPDSTHWLVEGPRLPIPGLTFRAGINDRLDAALYFTKSIGANYGFWGAQIQYNLISNTEKNWAASVRGNFTSMYGPDDLNLNIGGVDLIASKEFPILADRISIAPYAGISGYVSSSHEKTEAVNLDDEIVAGGQGMVGAVMKLYFARIGVEYNLAKVNTISFKIGATF